MTSPSLSLAPAVRALAAAATPPRRRLFAITIVLLLGSAVAELATIGAVLPFLALVTNPARADRYEVLAWLARHVGGGQDGLVMACALLLVAIAICAGALRLVFTWVNLRFILLYGHDLSRSIFGRLLRQPYSDYVTRNSSDAVAALEKLSAVVFGVVMPVMQGAAALVISVLIVSCLLLIDPFAASAAGLSLGATYLLVVLVTRRRLARNSHDLVLAGTGRVKVVQEGLGGIRDILIDNSQPVFEAAFAELDLRYRRALVTNNMIALAPRYLVETSLIVLIALFTVYFSRQPGGMIGAVPVLGALAIGAQRLLPLVHQAYNGWSAFAGNQQLIIEIAQMLRTRVVVTGQPQARADLQSRFARDIVLDDVSFRYHGGERALKHVSMTIRQGERVGFVGQTGSGKSTLIDLLMGLLLPSEGSIRIDGIPLTAENMNWWQAQIAHVPQTIYLSDGTIAANIAFGQRADEIDHACVIEAAKRAGIHDFVMDQPDGYAASVGERGVRLSGGQRQRIGIARALYKGASVLIFDEATSALDGSTEAAIMDSIYRLGSDVTLLLIAHRLSTLAGCDRTVRLDQGSVVAGEPAGTDLSEDLYRTHGAVAPVADRH